MGAGVPVAKQASTGAFMKNTLAAFSLSNRNSLTLSLISLFSAGLAATSSLTSME